MDTVDSSWREWLRLSRAQDSDPLEIVRVASMFERYFDAVKTEAVKTAKATGHSWEEISTLLGVSRQSAWERYRRAERVKSGDWADLGPFRQEPR
jgi:hypothetical protein